MAGTKLVIGASGFLGSHVVKQLVADGEPAVQVMIRTTSSTRGIDGHPVRTPLNIRLLHIMSPMDHFKAVRELGGQPRPSSEAVEAAARFFRDRPRRVAEGAR